VTEEVAERVQLLTAEAEDLQVAGLADARGPGMQLAEGAVGLGELRNEARLGAAAGLGEGAAGGHGRERAQAREPWASARSEAA
jgi:hypothetical protein